MNKPFKPTAQQSQAVDPSRSVWVTANAGSGKTHVLVERVIRLLLDGAEPSAILCITFTKAAAAEMASRLYERLGKWVSCTDEALASELAACGLPQSDADLQTRARRLFTRVLETPGGLKIQTIHALCERLLQLFPVEAGMAPGFRVLDDRQTLAMRQEAQSQILARARSRNETALTIALDHVVSLISQGDFDDLVASVLAAPQNLKTVFAGTITAEGFSLLLKNALKVELTDTVETLNQQLNLIDDIAYFHHATILAQAKPYRGHDAASLMKQAVAAREKAAILKQIFFTKAKEFEPRKTLLATDLAKAHPETKIFLEREAQRIAQLIQQLDVVKRIYATASLFTLAKAIFAAVDAKKRLLGLYDFDDLIERTARLLTGSGAAQWVLYKLDAGLSHILLDEAQDTSPAQWQIIQALADEFFSGSGKPVAFERTIFVVGDRKQSIYSFQGADAHSFALARQRFTDFILAQGKASSEIELTISYRSTEAVLEAVNKVFPAKLPARLGFLQEDLTGQDHTTNRKGAAGRVEVWPLTPSLDEADQPDHWLAPLDREPAQSAKRRLSRQIAETIKSWIGQRELPSQGRMVEPGDIMILLQSRGPLFSMLIAELRKARVPVAGADRLKLQESLAIQDLMAMAQWALLPEDDYSLACVLKSPFVPKPLSEVELFAFAHDRVQASLWSRVKQGQTENARWLESLLNTAEHDGPFAFFARILMRYRKAMLHRLGPEAGDATDACLDLTLAYEIETGLSLAGFVHWFDASETDIKRELEKNAGEVRIMTVHAAKGLEANIVFLPDAASLPKGRNANQMLKIEVERLGFSLPLWNLSGLSQSPALEHILADGEAKRVAERNRLLYVAMTRARDELYMCGAKGKTKDIPKTSWYALVEQVLGVSEITPLLLETSPSLQARSGAADPLPDWVLRAAKLEAEPQANSVTQSKNERQKSPAKPNTPEMQRGTAIHAILQALPQIAPELRQAFAAAKARRLDIDPQLAQNLVALIARPELAAFYGPGSAQEVEICGTLADHQLITGRLDRVVIGTKDVLLLDYKTDTTPPTTTTASHPYHRQMALYAQLLAQAYPTRNIRAALLWTQTEKLEWLSL
jgi:ATP-dependent helicase/nuclease subunit A